MLRCICLTLLMAMVLFLPARTGSSAAEFRPIVYLPLVSNDPPARSALGHGGLPPALTIVSSTGYMRDGGVEVVGEVLNRSGVPLYQVKVEAHFYDRNGVVVASRDAYALLTLVAPSRRVPFRLSLPVRPAGLVSYKVEVVDWRASSPLAYRSLTVVNAATRYRYGVDVVGDVRNPHADSIYGAKVAVTVYNGEGRVIDAQDGYAREPELAAGSVAAYRISGVRDVVDATYTVDAQGYHLP